MPMMIRSMGRLLVCDSVGFFVLSLFFVRLGQHAPGTCLPAPASPRTHSHTWLACILSMSEGGRRRG